MHCRENARAAFLSEGTGRSRDLVVKMWGMGREHAYPDCPDHVVQDLLELLETAI